MKKQLVFWLFIILVLVQWGIPGIMIYRSEDTFRNGEAFKFVLRPVDPTDPFRGEYITLTYILDEFATAEKEWKYHSDIFIILHRDENGIAIIKNVSPKLPASTETFVKAKVTGYYGGKVHFQLPFNRFYMEEYRAYEAERLFREQVGNSDNRAEEDNYAVVFIKGGHAVIADVFLGGKSVSDLNGSSN